MTKRVESLRVPCLDAGSTPATSTEVGLFDSVRELRTLFFFGRGLSRRVAPHRLWRLRHAFDDLARHWATSVRLPPPPQKWNKKMLSRKLSIFFNSQFKIHNSKLFLLLI